MELRELDAYARLPEAAREAHGSELVLGALASSEHGRAREVLDLYGGHCVSTLGAGDERLGALLAEQWRALSFQTNLLDHAPRHEFLARFGHNLPPLPAGEGWRVFCSNSGAEANENALKAALAASGRERVLAFGGAFHGRTAAASAVSDVARPAFPRTPFEVVRVPFGALDAARAALASVGGPGGPEGVGAVILEPIQSLAGVVAPPPGFLEGLRAACDEAGACLVFDEVQTGNGRLGAPWAAQHFGVVPDLFTTAKGAAGGLPIGLTVLRESVAARLPKGLFGSTFGGGPLVLAAAAEVARRIAEPQLLAHVRAASQAFRAAASACDAVESVRGAGLLLGLVLVPGLAAKDARDRLLGAGVLVGTSDDPRVLRLSPPLTVPLAAAERLAAALATLPTPQETRR